ncbi:MAG: thioredoxin family protein [Azoarcus sp.]|nr:thioredoxin family protein [Azoarcus sp.]
MKNFKVLGTGCSKCKNTVRLIEEIAAEKGEQVTVEKIEEIEKMMSYGIMATPGVVLDDIVVHAGGVPARSKVEGWF